MSNWIAIYDPPSDNEPPFECLVRGDVFDNCVWVGGSVGQYAQVKGSLAMPLPYMPSHWRPAGPPFCTRCGGQGVVQVMSDAGPDAHEIDMNCPHCGGDCVEPSPEFRTSTKDSGV